MTGGLSHTVLRVVSRQAQWLAMTIKQAGPAGEQGEVT